MAEKIDPIHQATVATGGDELRAELSLPVLVSERGVVTSWRERILLPPRTFGAIERIPADAGGGDEVDFDVAAL